MSLKPSNRPFRKFAHAVEELDGQLRTAGLFKVEEKTGKIRFEDYFAAFVINPESFQESKSSNWVSQTVPGQSDPVVQWISSGAKTLSFDALVTLDVFNISDDKQDDQKRNATINAGVEAKFAKIAYRKAEAQAIESDKFAGADDAVIGYDISNYLNYYRSLLYPKYKEDPKGRTLSESPPRLVLLAGRSISSIPYGETITPQNETWVLTDLKISITKMTSNLSPMEAIVSFTLMQYNEMSYSSEHF